MNKANEKPFNIMKEKRKKRERESYLRMTKLWKI